MSEKPRIAFLFPGQGSQASGMGKDYYENFKIARETFEEGEEILKSKLTKLIFEENESLKETKNCQVAIFLTSVAIYRVLKEQFPEITPEVCAGLSLGEYTALYASGRSSFSETLQLVKNRALYMHEECENTKGTMAAILGMPSSEVEKMVSELHLPQDLWIANFNCPEQVVLSGTLKGVEAGVLEAKLRGARKVIPLQVHGAFHSGLMERGARRLQPQVEQLMLRHSAINFVMNAVGDYVEDLAAIKQYLLLQITSPVRWEQGVSAMAGKGVETFIEVGSGRVLAGLNKRTVPQGTTISLDKVADLESLSQVK